MALLDGVWGPDLKIGKNHKPPHNNFTSQFHITVSTYNHERVQNSLQNDRNCTALAMLPIAFQFTGQEQLQSPGFYPVITQ